MGQCGGHSRPRLGPRKVFHPHSAPWALHPARTVAQLQGELPHRKIAPLSLRTNVVNLQASLSAYPAAQEPLSQPVDMHQHVLVGLFHLSHGMSFQMQLFSDKRLYEHLGPGPFVFLGRKHELNPLPGCPSNPRPVATPSAQRVSTAITLFGEEPILAAAVAGAVGEEGSETASERQRQLKRRTR